LIPKCTPACLYLRSLGCTPSRRRSVAAHRHLCRRSSGSMACLFDPICGSGEKERERLHQEEGCRGRTSGRGLIIGGGEQRVKGRDAAARAWRGEGIARGKGWPNGPHGTARARVRWTTGAWHDRARRHCRAAPRSAAVPRTRPGHGTTRASSCRAVSMDTVTRTAAAEEAAGRRRGWGRRPPASEGLAAADEVVGRSARRPSPPRMKAVAARE